MLCVQSHRQVSSRRAKHPKNRHCSQNKHHLRTSTFVTPMSWDSTASADRVAIWAPNVRKNEGVGREERWRRCRDTHSERRELQRRGGNAAIAESQRNLSHAARSFLQARSLCLALPFSLPPLGCSPLFSALFSCSHSRCYSVSCLFLRLLAHFSWIPRFCGDWWRFRAFCWCAAWIWGFPDIFL